MAKKKLDPLAVLSASLNKEAEKKVDQALSSFSLTVESAAKETLRELGLSLKDLAPTDEALARIFSKVCYRESTMNDGEVSFDQVREELVEEVLKDLTQIVIDKSLGRPAR